MLVHSLLIETVDLRLFGGAAAGNDFFSDHFNRCPEAAGEKNLGCFGSPIIGALIS